MKNIELKYLDWDSRQLDVSSGLIDLTGGMELPEAAELTQSLINLISVRKDIRFITVKLPAACAATAGALIRKRALLIDAELTFDVQPGNPSSCPVHAEKLRIEFLTKIDCAPFLPLANEMRLSRFYRDSRISSDKAQHLWQTSIRNHCEGLADRLLAAYCDDEPCGLVVIKLTENRDVYLNIVGVLKKFQGRKIGQFMLAKIIDEYSPMHRIYTETQSVNFSAQALYMKAGFQYSGLKYVLHYWGNNEQDNSRTSE
jgi:ribosomal protein S18 acetylase RimI-like enzyme